MNERDQVNAAQSLRAVQDEINSAAFAERQTMFAQAAFAKFCALRKARFNDAQALYLVGLSPL